MIGTANVAPLPMARQPANFVRMGRWLPLGGRGKRTAQHYKHAALPGQEHPVSNRMNARPCRLLP
jgi:hypothetical protein